MLWGEQDVQGRARRLFPGGLLPRPKRGGGEVPPQPAALSEAALLSLLSSNPCCAWKVRAGVRSRAPLPGPAAAGFGKRTQPWHEAVGAVLAACRRKRRSRGEQEKPSSMPQALTGASGGGNEAAAPLAAPKTCCRTSPRSPSSSDAQGQLPCCPTQLHGDFPAVPIWGLSSALQPAAPGPPTSPEGALGPPCSQPSPSQTPGPLRTGCVCLSPPRRLLISFPGHK